MKRTKLIVIVFVLAVIMSIPAVALAHAYEPDVPTRTEDGVVFVPLRLTAYAHGAAVEWDGENRLVIITSVQGNVWTVAVEAVGGFIEYGTSWIPYEYAVSMFGADTIDETVVEEESNVEDIIATITNAIGNTRSFVAERSEILSITSTDGYVFQSRLTMPDGDGEVAAIVIDAGTSGPNTFLMTRYTPGIGQWNYFDFWANEFVNNGVAFLSSNTRGVTPNSNPPGFLQIDEAGYLTYLPSNVVEDVYHMIRTVQSNPRLANAQIFLLGMSEGAVIASLFEETHPGMADALFMIGTPMTNMYDVVRWQGSGENVMMVLRTLFETDEYGRITQEAFYAGPWETYMGAPFQALDLNQDGFFTAEDLRMVWALQGLPSHMYNPDIMLDAIRRGDDEWIRVNYPVLLTSKWFLEHFDLRSNMELLPELDLPIYIFHGTLDMSVYVGYVVELYELLNEIGRSNITINIFPGHDHDLDWNLPAFHGEMSDGIRAVLDAVLARIRG